MSRVYRSVLSRGFTGDE